MWLVRVALQRPYTFVVMALLIILMGGVTLLRMPTDIFPEIDIPVISVIWNYSGLPPEEMEKRIVSNYERSLTTTVNDIEHIESQSLAGVAVVKVFFQPGAKINEATAQVTAISQTVIRQMPPGATPPLIMRYSASNVPVVQAALESDTLSESILFDVGANFLRSGLATVQGAQIPWPYGGKQRQVMVDLDLERLYAWGLSPVDVTNAVNAQNLILPSGTTKMGDTEYPVLVNSSLPLVSDLQDLPIKTVRGTTIYLRDVASVRDGFSPQTSIVHANGKKAALMSILKSGGASTLDIIKRIRDALPGVLSTLPKELKVTLLFDQSVFVRAAVEGVAKEAALAATLTALMILLFLGSWRSTLIVVVSIPLSILVAIIILGALGQTLNVMTLGGLALAVGILVDDATVEIENIHRRLEKKRPILNAILEGAQEIAVPAFVSTLCICIVFVPVAFIVGAARSLFVPLAMSVVFAMLTSYFLSRTLVPTMVRYLLGPAHADHDASAVAAPPKGVFGRFHERFEHSFVKLRTSYGSALAWALAHRPTVATAFAVLTILSAALLPTLGRDFFPAVDAGLIKLHVRGPSGLRIEETERLFARVQEVIRKSIPQSEVSTMLDIIGVPYSGINLALGDPSMISAADGEILISLHEHHTPTADHVRKLRKVLAEQLPEATFFFLAPDISTQVLNFGLSAPIDAQIVGPDFEANIAVAQELKTKMAAIPGAVDVHLHQVVDTPQLMLDIDRTRASQIGLTQRDAASAVLVSLSSSGQTAPNYWLDSKKGIQYLVAVQTPQRRIDSMETLSATPLVSAEGRPQLLANVANVSRTTGPINITHHNVARTIDVLSNVEGRDLGGVAADVERAVASVSKKLPRGTTIKVRGQVESMNSSFSGLATGILFAVILVYLLMAVNFQSWLDPFIILMALPGAIAGIAWTLFLTQTTLSVPALMGSIMCIGVATANSILLVTFANDRRKGGHTSVEAALAAGMTRLRPVLMTALAMIIGMLPMSLGLGEGGEQNAPLGRAVVGGLLVATFTTLFFVPVMYSWLRRAPPAPPIELIEV